MENKDNPAQAGQQIQIKASDETLRGLYSNMVQVGHNQEEFVLDFMNLLPPAGSLIARILVSPQHAKRIALALQDNVKKYEEQFGEIKASALPEHKIGFRTE